MDKDKEEAGVAVDEEDGEVHEAAAVHEDEAAAAAVALTLACLEVAQRHQGPREVAEAEDVEEVEVEERASRRLTGAP